MRSGRILLVADEYYASLAALRGLRAAGYDPWVGATTPDGYAHRSRDAGGVIRLPSPSDGDAEFATAAAAAAGRCGALAVLAGTEASTVSLSAHGAMPDGVALGAPSSNVIRRATDKHELAALAAAAGLAAPPTLPLDSDQLTFPAIVKPVRSAVVAAGGTHEAPNAVVVESAEQLRRAAAQHPGVELLAQPFVRGRLVAVAGVARDGDVVCTLHQTARRTFPRDCGVSAFAETIPRDEELDAGLRRLHAALGMTGIWEAQFVRDDEAAYLIDLNPRPYGSLALAVAAGLNLPAIWADVVLGREPLVTGYRVGQGFRAEMRELGFLTEALGARDVRAAARVLLPRPGTTHAVLSLRDPAPAWFLARRVAARLRAH